MGTVAETSPDTNASRTAAALGSVDTDSARVATTVSPIGPGTRLAPHCSTIAATSENEAPTPPCASSTSAAKTPNSASSGKRSRQWSRGFSSSARTMSVVRRRVAHAEMASQTAICSSDVARLTLKSSAFRL
ncbi:Uncharacterised protein [Mycobacteroides abscessus subsp. abscessus]|nr:Uncharacterised protein [Mycobacteroides abscessus subsp. abscessus]